MKARVHLISGLPRSGSTLLCAILRQNPRFSAAMTSPVASLLGALMPKMSGGSEFNLFFTDERRRVILRSVFEAYYSDVPTGHVIFDTNRIWTGKAALVADLYPEARIICCVREVGWVIDSIERMLRKNPLQLSRIFNFQPGSSVYARVEAVMNSDNGVIGLSWAALREAWFSEYADRLIAVRYESLAREPGATMKKLYAAIGEPLFAHDFDHVTYDEVDFDAALGMPGMHKVEEKVEYRPRQPCIPPDIFAKYAEASFWLRAEMNRGAVTIL